MNRGTIQRAWHNQDGVLVALILTDKSKVTAALPISLSPSDAEGRNVRYLDGGWHLVTA